MPLDAPFRLGPFIVDVHGRLEPGDPGQFPSFHLHWRGCPVHARLAAAEPAAPAQLSLSATVGRVPSSAGGDALRNRERRSAALGALQGLEGPVAGGNVPQLRLLPDHRVVVDASRSIEMPASAGDLLTQITCFLLDVGPYLDLFAEADVPVEAVGAAPSSSGGTAKI